LSGLLPACSLAFSWPHFIAIRQCCSTSMLSICMAAVCACAHFLTAWAHSMNAITNMSDIDAFQLSMRGIRAGHVFLQQPVLCIYTAISLLWSDVALLLAGILWLQALLKNQHIPSGPWSVSDWLANWNREQQDVTYRLSDFQFPESQPTSGCKQLWLRQHGLGILVLDTSAHSCKWRIQPFKETNCLHEGHECIEKTKLVHDTRIATGASASSGDENSPETYKADNRMTQSLSKQHSASLPNVW